MSNFRALAEDEGEDEELAEYYVVGNKSIFRPPFRSPTTRFDACLS
jgi:hypothetical protein